MLPCSKPLFLLVLFFFASKLLPAATISGTVTDEKGQPLAFASVTVKGSAKGAVANSRGYYVLNVDAGNYVLVCHHVGYRTEEKAISVQRENLQVDFQLFPQELKMPEVVIRRGEDPALEIMRQAIHKREFYNRQVDSFTVDVYIKALVRSRTIPNRIMGQKVDKEEMTRQGIDSSGKGILFLSESLTKVAYKRPDKIKMEVVSSRQSGGGFGLSVPFFVNFYTNNVDLFSGDLAPRGFVSPLADGAFHFYRFRYEGNFFEGDKMIDRIRVTPRRKNEPLFEGYIQIVDGDWRIHSLNLTTNKQYGLDLLDTVRVTQVHSAVTGEIWRTQNQVISFAASVFGFGMAGDFLNVYSNYDLDPGFHKKYFDRVLMKFDTAFNRRDSVYWSKLRPMPLEPDEKQNFFFRDSLRKADRDSMYSQTAIDSLRRAQKPVRLRELLSTGIARNSYSASSWKTYSVDPLLQGVQFNSVEGPSLSLQQGLLIRPKDGSRNYEAGWNIRYGFSNGHLNSDASFAIRQKEEFAGNNSLRFSGGKRLLQFNRDNPIDEFSNSISSLFYHSNYLKLYEAWFGKMEYNRAFESGLRMGLTFNYEDRLPVENSTEFSFFHRERQYTPNHPYELAGIPFERHAATVASVVLAFQAKQYYIALPGRKIPVGSKYPTFALQYTRGIPDLFASTADFDKWKFSVYDDTNLKLLGTFKYRFSVGGFLNNRHVDIPDFTHFNGNQTTVNFNYLNSFQLAPYYRYSNTERFYTLLHAEHHFNGLLTNKIPLFNKLKWNLVIGTNTFYVNRHDYYVEAFAGLENIFKIFRVDFVTATQAEPGRNFGIRIGFGGVIGNGISRRK